MNPVLKYAKRFGGKCGTLKQDDFISKYALDNREGVCYALSLLYISLHAKGIDFGSIRKDESTWKLVDGLHSVCRNFHDKVSWSSRFVPEWVRASAPLVGLRVLVGDLCVSPFYFEISSALETHRGGALLHIGGHACAVFKEKDGRVRFFEPNYGQATFVLWENFVAFLYFYLRNRKIEREYNFAVSGIYVYRFELA
ncbi:YopT-type cysteine protease domain-containing protein [Pseudomonas batumici]|uniref:YopT-type cysteine protease domain-containing protein n=1 Tax=Pseudomonas batumici TaxID=226910 RepID=UPI000589B18E|nr:YopT-type cysteine protease domain-containing protein [Pseudomonas batumici]